LEVWITSHDSASNSNREPDRRLYRHLTLKRNKNRKQSCEKAWPPPIAGVSCTLTRASRLLRQKTATAAPLALSRN
jgi:hypothetical protein